MEEFNPQLTELNRTLEELAYTMQVFQNVIETMGKPMEKFEPVAKKMNTSKFAKSAKTMDNMFKNIAGATPQAFLIQKLFNTLSPLVDLFKPFQVILDIISSLISVMVGTALKPMFEALQPIYDMFMSFMPIFIELGEIIGELISAILTPLVEIFIMLQPLIQKVLTVFVQLMAAVLKPIITIIQKLMAAFMPILEAILPPIIELLGMLMEAFLPLIELAFLPLMLIVEMLTPILEALTPLFEALGDVMEVIGPFIEIISKGMINFINMIIKGINFVMNALTFGAWKDIKLIGEVVEEIGEAIRAGTFTSPVVGGRRVTEAPGLQEGGGVLSRGIYEIGEKEGEWVIPMSKWERQIGEQISLQKAMHDELVSLSYYNRRLVKIEEHNQIFGARRK